MTLMYENLDANTRQFMLKEMELDISKGELYISTRLNQQGKDMYASLLNDAIQSHDDEWLANELRRLDYMNAFENRTGKNGISKQVRVPINAPDILAEGEFNRFYIRGLCLRALEENIPAVEVYRGKQVNQPRPESEVLIGKSICANRLLNDLRASRGIEPALNLPPGPNSGLTARLFKVDRP